MKNPVVVSPLFMRIWDKDTFSSLTIMGMRIGMLVAKFLLSIFIARFMGLEDLGIYGLIVAASATVQTVLRGGIFPLLSRDAVHNSLAKVTHDLRHYGIGILLIYLTLVPVALGIGWYFDNPVLALLTLAVFFTDHLAFDTFVLASTLQYPKLANFLHSLQAASWIYLFMIFALLYPPLRSLENLLVFWVGGGVVSLAIVAWISRKWPWKQAFAQNLEWLWYHQKIKRSFRIYLTDVLGVLIYYMDRYIVTVFLSLEMTGIYVFFAQVVTATWNLIDSGVLVIYRPRLIQLYDPKNMEPFNNTFRRCLKRTYFATILLALVTGFAVPVLVKLTHNEMLLDHIPLLWIMLGALLFRISETCAGTGLFAMAKDQENFIMNIIGFVLTVIVGSAGVIAFGVFGIVLNTVVVATVSVLYARAIWVRPSNDINKRDEQYA